MSSTYSPDLNPGPQSFGTQCWCDAWVEALGTTAEAEISNNIQYFAISVSIAPLLFYAWHTWKATCGWEEIYVCSVELAKCFVEMYYEYDSPFTLFLSTGNQLLLIRYCEWLLTCPVILIQLANITGLKDSFSKRTMRLLVTDVGTIVCGIASAASVGPLKIAFFCAGLMYGANTFFHAAKVYIESYHMVPRGRCKLLVRMMALIFFLSWAMFPVWFVLGPEGFGVISHYGSDICTVWTDLMSKNLWGLVGHHLRVSIHEHILLYGDIRKTTVVEIAGEKVEIEEYVEEEDEETVKHSTKELANRGSFIIMRDRMQARGIDTRASLDDTSNASAYGKGLMNIEVGRVILVVPDMSMLEFFNSQFGSLPVQYELVPAMGLDNALQLIQQANALGGCDFVLLHPEFLQDKSSNSAIARLRMAGQRVCAFGWSPSGPVKDLIESSGIDGWLQGPSFGTGINQAHLLQLIAQMQALRRSGMMMGMGGMGMGNGGGMGMGMGGGMGGGAGPGMGSGFVNYSMPSSTIVSPLLQNPPANVGQMAEMQQQQLMGQATPGRMNAGQAANPLFNMSPAQSPAPAATVDEAAMLQQLMGEINRLKAELGENN